MGSNTFERGVREQRKSAPQASSEAAPRFACPPPLSSKAETLLDNVSSMPHVDITLRMRSTTIRKTTSKRRY
eukprot:3689666-Rhodomonas_salina.2